LRAAQELFYDQGYGVSVDAIAEHASVAKPTVYAHFASKESLIGATLESFGDQWFTDLDAELERREGDPIARLMAPFDLLVANLPDPRYHGCLFVNSAAAFCSPDHPARRAMAAHDERMHGLFETLAADAGAARPGNIADQLLLLYDGVKARGLVDHTGRPGRDARAIVTALLQS
jgi:AcrR family transcriptional regulator